MNIVEGLDSTFFYRGAIRYKGNQGTVRFADYLENTHKNMIARPDAPVEAFDHTLVGILNTAWTVEPYFNPTFTNPSTEFTDTESRYSDLNTLVTGLDPSGDWEGFIDDVTTKLDTLGILDPVDVDSVFTDARTNADLSVEAAIEAALDVLDDVVIRAAVKAFERRQDSIRRRSVNRFAGTMSDINAVQSSAFIFGMALIEAEHIQSVGDFDSNLSTEMYSSAFGAHIDAYKEDVRVRLTGAMQNKQTRDQLVADSVRLITTSLYDKTQLDHAVASLKAEINRIKVVGRSEYELQSIELEKRNALWDLELMIKGGGFLGALGGGQLVPDGPSLLGSALGGALSGGASGALAGAQIGAAGGPIGAAGGAAIGAVLGLGSALLQ